MQAQRAGAGHGDNASMKTPPRLQVLIDEGLIVEGVLLMELVADADGHAAPRLNDVPYTPETAREHHALLLREVVRMLCAGVVHGDLSEFNILLAQGGPVIIDLPQAVDAAGRLSPETPLTGQYEPSPGAVDLSAVLREIEAARLNAAERDLRRGATP